MSSSPFETDAAFWMMCLGTFFAIQAVAIYFGAKIINKNGERLQQKIMLTAEDMNQIEACKGLWMALPKNLSLVETPASALSLDSLSTTSLRSFLPWPQGF